MVRGVRSNASAGHGMLFSILAEMTVPDFFAKSLIGSDPEATFYEEQYTKLVFAMAVVGLMADYAMGWEFAPYVDGRVIARMDGEHPSTTTNLLYKYVNPTPFEVTSKLLDAVKKLPEPFLVRGSWFSRDEDMKTTALEMRRETFLKLLQGTINMETVTKEVAITEPEPLLYTNEFSPNRWAKMKESPSNQWDAFDNTFMSNDVYRIVQGYANRWEFSQSWTGYGAGAVLDAIMKTCVAARFSKRNSVPRYDVKFNQLDGRNSVIVYLTNKRVAAEPWKLANLQIPNTTSRWVGYATKCDRLGDGDPTLWQHVRPLFAIIQDATADFINSVACWEKKPLLTPAAPSELHAFRLIASLFR